MTTCAPTAKAEGWCRVRDFELPDARDRHAITWTRMPARCAPTFMFGSVTNPPSRMQLRAGTPC